MTALSFLARVLAISWSAALALGLTWLALALIPPAISDWRARRATRRAFDGIAEWQRVDRELSTRVRARPFGTVR